MTEILVGCLVALVVVSTVCTCVAIVYATVRAIKSNKKKYEG